MDDHCECCGVKYTGERNLKPGQLIDEGSDRNFKWNPGPIHMASGKICLFCATELPGWLVIIAIDYNHTWKEYNFQNFKSYPILADRIKSIKFIQSIFSCPRCGTEMKKIESVAPFSGEKEMINKCFNCGYC